MASRIQEIRPRSKDGAPGMFHMTSDNTSRRRPNGEHTELRKQEVKRKDAGEAAMGAVVWKTKEGRGAGSCPQLFRELSCGREPGCV